MLLLLEGDGERLKRFAALMRSIAPELHVHIWRDAHAMIQEAGPLLPATSVISLDHDLVPEPGAPTLVMGTWLPKGLLLSGLCDPSLCIPVTASDQLGWLVNSTWPGGDTGGSSPSAMTGSSSTGDRE